MDEDSSPHHITLKVVYAEDGYLLGVKAAVAVGHWAGKAEAWTYAAALQKFASELMTFVENPKGEVAFVAGDPKIPGAITLRFYPIDRSKHLVCHVRLASDPQGDRPETIWRLEIEPPVETMAILRFAREIQTMAERLDGRAVLETDIV